MLTSSEGSSQHVSVTNSQRPSADVVRALHGARGQVLDEGLSFRGMQCAAATDGRIWVPTRSEILRCCRLLCVALR